MKKVMSRMEIPRKEYGAYIFDLDGTLVDSMPQHYDAWKHALEEVNLPVFDEETYYSMGGRSATDIVSEMAVREGRADVSPEAVAVAKRKYYFEQLERNPARPIPEVLRFVRERQGRVPMAIATGSARPGALKTLRCAGMEGLFDIIVTPEDVKHGKPAPDMFLLAASRMGVSAADCCVFEDAVPGMMAATAAGMDFVRIARG